ncbi:hypothetical protein [Aegicerativicinus sediminis]
MRNYIIVLLFSLGMLGAQASTEQNTTEVKVGDTFEIGKPETNTYKHINFPRANFIIKGGGIADYNNLEGKKVVVTSVKEKADGTTEVKIKRANGMRFFRSHTVVSANIEQALNSGELKVD